MDVAGLADQIRSRTAGAPLIVSECPGHTPRDKAAWVWVFRENTKSRLEMLWSGVLTRLEIDLLEETLRRSETVWRGGIETNHEPGDSRFRLVWTLPPAPCRVYKRRGLSCEVERSRVTVRGFWRSREFAADGVESVEGWILPSWWASGVTLRLAAGTKIELLRVREWWGLPNTDGFDDFLDRTWLASVTPRVAEVLRVGWSVIDYSATPPEVFGSSSAAPETDSRNT